MIKIFIDIDNIVADFETSFRKFLNKKLHRRLLREDITEFSFWKSYSTIKPKEKRFYIEALKKLLKLLRLKFLAARLEPKTLNEGGEKKLHKEFLDKNGYKKLKRVKNCKNGIKTLKRFYDVKFITARPMETRDSTLKWFKKKKILIKDDILIFDKNKRSYTSKFDIIIEDRWKDSIELAENDKEVLLFDYPWNRKIDENGNIFLHENIIRVSNWKELIESIDKIAEEKYKKELKDDVFKIWKESIGVQMHFNQLIMRNRITVSSVIFAAFGAALAFFRSGETILEINQVPFYISDVIIGIAAIGLFSYFWIDTKYYFRLLLGAVNFTEKMDREYKKLGLSSSITKSIKYEKARWVLQIHYLIISFALIVYILARIYL